MSFVEEISVKEQEFIGILVIAYNRPKSLNRLLQSLKNANYLGDNVNVIISIDYCEENNHLVCDIAENFSWPFGKKEIIKHSKNLGLKRHVLSCGEYLKDYNHLCVFEDDIYVSPNFYNYSKQAVKFYHNVPDIAGISLYTHQINYLSNRPFQPIHNGHDAYFMQQAQSWGQIWSKKTWFEFIEWIKVRGSSNIRGETFPKIIYDWPNSSWLKLHMQFLVETNKYFVYPFTALSTNFSDSGTHAKSTKKFQVELSPPQLNIYSFPKFEKEAIKYDVYFENINLKNLIASKLSLNSNVTIDLYQSKEFYERYVLTTKRLNFKILRKFGLNLRPHELNIIFNYEGEGIYLYDTSISTKNLFKEKISLNLYDYKTITIKKAILVIKEKLRKKVFSNFN